MNSAGFACQPGTGSLFGSNYRRIPPTITEKLLFLIVGNIFFKPLPWLALRTKIDFPTVAAFWGEERGGIWEWESLKCMRNTWGGWLGGKRGGERYKGPPLKNVCDNQKKRAPPENMPWSLPKSRTFRESFRCHDNIFSCSTAIFCSFKMLPKTFFSYMFTFQVKQKARKQQILSCKKYWTCMEKAGDNTVLS